MAIDTTKKVKKITVDGKSMVLVASGGEEAVIKLPEEFGQAQNIYYFKVNEDKYLISSSGGGDGLWEYTPSTETSVKMIDGVKWQYFQQTPKGILISSGNSADKGVYFYDTQNGSISRLSQLGYAYSRFVVLTNGDIIMQSSGTYTAAGATHILLYRLSDNTVSSIFNSNNVYVGALYFYEAHLFPDDTLIFACSGSNGNSSSYSYGILKYDPQTQTITRIVTSGYAFKIIKLSEYEIFINNRTTLYHYSIVTKQLTQIGADINFGNNYLSGSFKIGNNFVLIPTASSQPIRLAKGDTFEVSELYTHPSGVSASTYYLVPMSDTEVLISGSNSSYGVLLYDNTTETITQIYSTGYVDFTKVGSKAIGYNATEKAILSFDIDTKTIETIYSGQYSVKIVIGNNILFSSTSSSVLGVLLYNGQTHTISKAYAAAYGWGDSSYKYIINGNCILAAMNSQGILLFDAETMTIEKKYSYYRLWSSFKEDGKGNVYISGTNTSYNDVNSTLFYNHNDKTINLVEYKIS